MKHKESAGAIIWRKKLNKLEFLLSKSQAYKQFPSYWSFPKGHLEDIETHHQAAQREVFEEVGLKPIFDFDFSTNFTYQVTENIEKTVTLYLAKAVEGQIIKVQPSEIKQANWFNYHDALTLLNDYPDLVSSLKQANSYLLNN